MKPIKAWTTCLNCGKPFVREDSLMGDEGQCQMCWEAECDRSWWQMVTNFPGAWCDPAEIRERKSK